jgi:hypothetical protein
VGRFDADGFLAVVRCMLTTRPATGNISNVIPAEAGKCHPDAGGEWLLLRQACHPRAGGEMSSLRRQGVGNCQDATVTSNRWLSPVCPGLPVCREETGEYFDKNLQKKVTGLHHHIQTWNWVPKLGKWLPGGFSAEHIPGPCPPGTNKVPSIRKRGGNH